MANIKISQLPEASTMEDDDITMIVQSGVTKKISKSNLGISSMIDYTESETVVGTWIDGKPIYRQVLTATEQNYFSPNTTLISGVDNIIDYYGQLQWLNGMGINNKFPIPLYDSNNFGGYCYIGIDGPVNGNASFQGQYRWNSFKGYVVIFYTKLSDTIQS